MKHRRIAILLPLLALSACTTLKRPEEAAWQALHVGDALMTNAFVDSPCYREGDNATRALIGEHPNHQKVALWYAGEAAAHLYVSDALVNTHPTLYKVWQSFTIGASSYALYEGWRVGVRIGGPNTRTAQNGCKP